MENAINKARRGTRNDLLAVQGKHPVASMGRRTKSRRASRHDSFVESPQACVRAQTKPSNKPWLATDLSLARLLERTDKSLARLTKQTHEKQKGTKRYRCCAELCDQLATFESGDGWNVKRRTKRAWEEVQCEVCDKQWTRVRALIEIWERRHNMHASLGLLITNE